MLRAEQSSYHYGGKGTDQADLATDRNSGLHHAHPKRAGEPFGGRRKRGQTVDAEAAFLVSEEVVKIRGVPDNEISVGDLGIGIDRRLQGRPVISISARLDPDSTSART